MLEEATPESFDPQAKTLQTWALECEPVPGTTIAAVQLKNHRAWYLDNDGPLTGDRGSVHRKICGDFEWLENHVNFKLIRIRFGQRRWTVAIEQSSSGDFEVTIVDDLK